MLFLYPVCLAYTINILHLLLNSYTSHSEQARRAGKTRIQVCEAGGGL